MVTALAKQDDQTAALVERVVMAGDLGKLSPADRLQYYRQVCESIGLNPLTQPFAYLSLNGKLVLYATKAATDQLRSLRKVSVEVTSQQTIGDIHVVNARARTPDGRTDEEVGAVNIKGLGGEALANAYMKALTKAKRRVTLSICGLGMLDESEIASIPDARPVLVNEVGVIDAPRELPEPPNPDPVGQVDEARHVPRPEEPTLQQQAVSGSNPLPHDEVMAKLWERAEKAVAALRSVGVTDVGLPGRTATATELDAFLNDAEAQYRAKRARQPAGRR
ncbi:MAG TPA: hypothetical protein VD926_09065 [Acidimicrobiales bacterium]|nr:hypothetical protein [Acidimicrobiales bacterium]